MDVWRGMTTRHAAKKNHLIVLLSQSGVTVNKPQTELLLQFNMINIEGISNVYFSRFVSYSHIYFSHTRIIISKLIGELFYV